MKPSIQPYQTSAQSQTRSRYWAALSLIFTCTSTMAMNIDIGNPDITLSWGNTLRYNLGIRTHRIDPVIANSRNTDEGTLSYERWDVVTNRIDLLSELDFDFRGTVGARVSAAAWRDFAFHDDVHFNPKIPNNRPSYFNAKFSSTTARFHGGPSGEFLDAYVYGNFHLGDKPLTLKIGRQTTLWGEAIFLQPFGISDEQAPLDTIKLVTTPGVDLKEIAIPVGQVSASFQLTPKLTLLGQYIFEHRNTRLPQGGTYLGSTDFLLDGPDQFPLPGGAALVNKGFLEPTESGNWGVGLRWSPDWLRGGELGLYHRRITETIPAVSVDLRGGGYRYFFPTDERATGLSVTSNLSGVSVGAEIVQRENTVLNSSVMDASLNVARGTVWTGLLNAMQMFGPNALWSSATLITELGYTHRSKITSGEQYFLGCYKRPQNDQGAETGCSTRDNWALAIRFTPSWTAVVPGWDSSVSFALTYGLKGNSSMSQPSHGQERVGSYSIGNTWTYNTKYDFTLAYIGYLATYEQINGVIRVSNGSQRQDRNWLSFTFKASF